jgi:transposase
MKLSPPELKQFILNQYRCKRHGSGFDALAQRYEIAGGGKTIQRWYQQWDGTVESLKKKPGAGRPRLLEEAEITQHISIPIKRKNRRSQPIHYTDILRPLQEQTQKKISLRTVQRYGKENAEINSKRTIKKTKWECKFLIHITLHCCSISFRFGSLDQPDAHPTSIL